MSSGGSISPKRSRQTLLQLHSLANSDQRFTTEIWKRLVGTFEGDPELAQRFAELRATIRKPPAARDPFISALRRIAWPSDRLPAWHRRAVSEVGRAPLAFARLALEEARTWSWRTLNPDALGFITQWFGRLPFKDIDPRASTELIVTARTYDALATLRFGEPEDCRPALRKMCELEPYIPAESKVVVEGLFGLGLHYARNRDEEAASECFRNAEAILARWDGEDRGELSGFLHLFRAWAVGSLTRDYWRMECLETDALAKLDATADPWLTLFIHHEAAHAAMTAIVNRANGNYLVIPGGPKTGHRDRHTADFVQVQKALFDHRQTEGDTIARALAHLEAAEPLFAEFRTDEFAKYHLWLEGHAYINEDPIKAMDRFLESALTAAGLGHVEEANFMTGAISYQMMHLDHLGPSPKQVDACRSRANTALLDIAIKIGGFR